MFGTQEIISPALSDKPATSSRERPRRYTLFESASSLAAAALSSGSAPSSTISRYMSERSNPVYASSEGMGARPKIER